MTFSFLWFAVGLAVGVNATLAGLWWSLRRENRKALNEARVGLDAFLESRRTSQFPQPTMQEIGKPPEFKVEREPLASRRADP